TARSDSGSSCSPNAVEPATSAKSTVTIFRTSRRLERLSAEPQEAQKRASSGLTRPQFSHADTCVAYETSLPNSEHSALALGQKLVLPREAHWCVPPALESAALVGTKGEPIMR